MRILLSSNFFGCSTGYATQSRLLLKGWQEIGHTVAQHAFYGVSGTSVTVDDIPVYPSFRGMWGEDILSAHADHFGADLIVNFHDLWVLPQDYRDRFPKIPWCVYFPVDSVPAAPMTVTQAKRADFAITYSKFGYQQMREAGLETTYIPHAFDSQVFKPGDRGAARETLKIPKDAYVYVMVAANKGYPSRKAFPETLTAFAEIRKRHKDAVLFLHTARSPIGHQNDGIYFGPLLDVLGLNDGSVYFTPEYLQCVGAEEDYVARVYQAADVLVNCAYGEGFGLAILEAQATGCPVIVQNVTSMPELVFSGRLVQPAQKYWNLLGCWQFVPDVKQIEAQMDAAYRGEIPRVSDEQIAQIRGEYDIKSVVAKYWAKFFSLAQVIGKRPEPQVSVAVERPMTVETEGTPEQLGQAFERIAKGWDELSAKEPYWSILTHPEYLRENFEKNREMFFETGRADLERFFSTLKRIGIDPTEFATCLEFGCGVGRVTKWLAEHYKVFAYDACDSYLSECRINVPAATVLQFDPRHSVFPPVDVIYSRLVLQHNPPPVIAELLRQFSRALKPGGLAYFQLPTFKDGYSFSFEEYLGKSQDRPMELHVFPQQKVLEIFQQAGCYPLDIVEDDSTGAWRCRSNVFLFQKQAARRSEAAD